MNFQITSIVVSWLSLLIVLFVVDKPLLALGIMITAPLLLICWLMMKIGAYLEVMMQGTQAVVPTCGLIVRAIQLWGKDRLQTEFGENGSIDWDAMLRRIEEDED